MIIDVTDATFETEVLNRSMQTPVVVDLWAPWCGPCKTLGPILEKVVSEQGGQVVLAKVNVDDNPQTAAAFRVQGIPAVYALSNGQVVNGFVGAQGEAAVRELVEALLPTPEQSEVERLLEAGDEASLLRVLELEPANDRAITGLAELAVLDGRPEAALALLEKIPESGETRRIAALARVGSAPTDGVESKLDALLDRVRDDEDARQELLDLLEVLGPDDPRTNQYRRAMASRLF